MGTFAHDVARSWIVIELLGKAGALGGLQMAVALPAMFLMLQAGVLVDRVDIKKVIVWTKSLLGISSLLLALVYETSSIEYWHLILFALVEGFILSFDSPAFQTVTVRLVPREEFQQAIAVNSTNFHASRMLGPILAAFLMQLHGPGLVFIVDGVTYLVLAFVMKGVELRHVQRSQSSLRHGAALLEGVRYVARDPLLRYKFLQLIINISVAFPVLMAVYRVYLQQKFNLSATEFGWVFAFPAAGSLLGALTFAFVKPENPLNALKLGIPLATIGLLSTPYLDTLMVAALGVSALGFALYLSFAALTVAIQLRVSEDFRGRVSAMVGLAFVGLGPLLSFPWGVAADHFGAENVITSSGLILLILSALLAYRHNRHLALSQVKLGPPKDGEL